MKIKCKSCGKRFDPEMYSGLCPKCGTYNKLPGPEDEVSRYLNGGFSGEEAHRKLHETYGDTGHAKDAHERLHAGYQDTGHAKEAGGRRKVSTFTTALVALLFLIPVIFFISFVLFEKKTAQAFVTGDIQEIVPVGNTLVFSGEPFEEPVTVEVLGVETVREEELNAEGKQLLAVRLRTFCDGYNFDAAVNEAMLEYGQAGKTFYVRPLDSWYAGDYLSDFGVSEEDMLSIYGLGHEGEKEGYFLFCIPQNATGLSLLLMAGKGEGESLLFLEGKILLNDSLWEEVLP